MKFSKKLVMTAVAALAVAGVAAAATLTFHDVKPSKFDPLNTKLVASQWIPGIGCPTNAKQTLDGTTTSTSYTDGACPTGDSADKDNKGLLMAKTGPTANFAAAFAQLKDIPSPNVTELGYDLRKPNGTGDPSGSHCGGGAPRFQVYTSTDPNNPTFVGCNSGTVTHVGNGWIRVRWTGLTFTNVTAIYLAFDEGQDASGGPDQFGAAVLDNIDLNGKLVGKD